MQQPRVMLITLTDANYTRRIRRYLETLHQYCNVPAFVGYVGCQPDSFLVELPSIGNFTVPAAWLSPDLGNPGNNCIQHGSWLPYAPQFGADDLIILTDGDIRMQRPIAPAELTFLTHWPDLAIGIGPNAGPDDDLLLEARRIGCSVPLDQLPRLWGGGPAPLCGNAGVLIMRRSMWYRLWAMYLRLWPTVGDLFASVARNQWIINLAIELLGAIRIVLPQSMHTHGHFGPQPGVSGFASGPGDRSVVTFEGAPVLLAHRCW